jgi:hypothetical protein
MTTIAIMQPYFFPYLGYFQLLNSVDHFIVLDDVNMRKRSFITRNTIAQQHQPHAFTVACSDLSQSRFINAHVRADPSLQHEHWLRQLHHAYAATPHYAEVMSWLSPCLRVAEPDLTMFLQHTLRATCAYLNINCQWHLASDFACQTRGQTRIIQLCQALGANRYINLSGGKTLYEATAFARAGITLEFIHCTHTPRLGQEHLSIIDNLMHYAKLECQQQLQQCDYELAHDPFLSS